MKTVCAYAQGVYSCILYLGKHFHLQRIYSSVRIMNCATNSYRPLFFIHFNPNSNDSARSKRFAILEYWLSRKCVHFWFIKTFFALEHIRCSNGVALNAWIYYGRSYDEC